MSVNGSVKILLTGATGFLGSAISRRLVEDEQYQLISAVRKKSGNLISGIPTVLIEGLYADTDWSSALSNIQVVIHTAARVHVMNESSCDPLTEFRKINVEGTLNLARQAAAAGVNRFIFISSIKVNGESTVIDEPFTANDQPNPVDPYGISKWESEVGLQKLAKETDMDIVIIRPPLVYGPGVKANFYNMMRWISRGIPLPLGAIKNKRSLLALDNLVDLIIVCVEHPAASNQVFLVSDGNDFSTTELLIEVGKALGTPARLIPIPAGVLKIAAISLGKRNVSQRVLGSLQVDITKTQELLNWEPPVSVEEALLKTANDFLKKKNK